MRLYFVNKLTHRALRLWKTLIVSTKAIARNQNKVNSTVVYSIRLTSCNPDA